MIILIVSDIHGNREAFEAVIDAAGSFDAMWCLGDVVGYGPDPSWCVTGVVSLAPAVWLAGNHDLAAIGRIDAADFNAVARAAIAWTTTMLTCDQFVCLRSLPSLSESHGVTLAHGSPNEPTREYISDERTAMKNLSILTTEWCIVGHTHVAAVSERPSIGPVTHRRWDPDKTVNLSGRTLILNPGSVGQPRDLDPRVSFALLDLERATIQLRQVSYDLATVQTKIGQAGLPMALAERLAHGR